MLNVVLGSWMKSEQMRCGDFRDPGLETIIIEKFLMKIQFFRMEFGNLGVRDIPNTQIPEFDKIVSEKFT